MAVNRYDTPIRQEVISSHVPMPLDFMNQKIQERQSTYDQTKATIDENQDARAGMKALSPDRDRKSYYDSEYDKIVDDALSKAGGDYSKVSSNLAQRISNDMTRGEYGAIDANWQSAQTHMQEVTDQYDKGDISKQGYDRALSSINLFGGTRPDNKGGYIKASFYTPAKMRDLDQLSIDSVKAIGDKYTEDGRQYKDLTEMQNITTNTLYNDVEARKNAEEILWAKYGEDVWASTPKLQRDAAVIGLLQDRAALAADRYDFEERYKPTAGGTGSNATTFDLAGEGGFGGGETTLFGVGRAGASVTNMRAAQENLTRNKTAQRLMANLGIALSYGSTGSAGGTQDLDTDYVSGQSEIARSKNPEILEKAQQGIHDMSNSRFYTNLAASMPEMATARDKMLSNDVATQKEGLDEAIKIVESRYARMEETSLITYGGEEAEDKLNDVMRSTAIIGNFNTHVLQGYMSNESGVPDAAFLGDIAASVQTSDSNKVYDITPIGQASGAKGTYTNGTSFIQVSPKNSKVRKEWIKNYGKPYLTVAIEPGRLNENQRLIAAESQFKMGGGAQLIDGQTQYWMPERYDGESRTIGGRVIPKGQPGIMAYSQPDPVTGIQEPIQFMDVDAQRLPWEDQEELQADRKALAKAQAINDLSD